MKLQLFLLTLLLLFPKNGFTRCGELPSYGSGPIVSGDMKRNLNCEQFEETSRAKAICCSLEGKLEFEWFGGHGSFAPGWRTQFPATEQVFCEVRIADADRATLTSMKVKSKESQLMIGATFLLELLHRSTKCQK